MHFDANAMEHKRARMTHIWRGTGLLLVITLGLALLGRQDPLTLTRAMLMAASGATGLLAMAWLLSRETSHPRWAWFATAGVMAVSLVASVFLVGDPVAWEREIRPSAWMLPWTLLAFSMFTRTQSAACLPAAGAGWIMVATGLLLSILLLGLPFPVRWLMGSGMLW